MTDPTAIAMIRHCYKRAFEADIRPAYDTYVGQSGLAALGYTRAGEAPLFLERYLDQPIEAHASAVLNRQVARGSIVEIGNFAACSAMAILTLWGQAANDLGSGSEIAAATLTAPLRRMFARIGVPIIEIASARPESLGNDAAHWGSYYDQDPRVCIGEIAAGQDAISAWLGRRNQEIAA